MQEKRTKTFIYKRCQIFSDDSGFTPSQTLEDLLAAALIKCPDADKRAQQPTANPKEQRLINTCGRVPKSKMLCGDLFDYTAGSHQVIVTVASGKKVFKVSSMAPPGKEDQFLESALHFGVIRNHVVVMQSKSLRAQQLCDYLNWFLTDCAGVLTNGAKIVFNDQLSQSIIKKFSGVRSLSLTSSATTLNLSAAAATTKRSAIEHALREFGAKLTKEFELSLKKALADRNVQLKMQLIIGGRAKKGEPSALDELAELLRYVDDSAMELDVPGLGKLKGEELRLNHKPEIVYDDNIPTLTEIGGLMRDWIKLLAHEKRIDSGGHTIGK